MKNLLSKIINRKEQVENFLKFLETETSWLTAPASTRFHLCKEGGLIEHSVGVANTLLKLKATMAPQISDESCVIVALFHDLGKTGFPGFPYYLPNTDEWQKKNRGIHFITNPDCVTMSIGVQSLHLISQHVQLFPEEVQAIASHDGLYPTNGGVVNLEYHMHETPLTLLLQFADKWTAAIHEDERKIQERN
jgi:hypothetical protein